MTFRLRITARVIAVGGCSTLSALHFVWAAGHPWPARDAKQLAEAVVGQSVEMPAAPPTGIVALGSAGVAALATGMFGHGSMPRTGLRAMGAIMILRALLGGSIALRVLGLPPAGQKFRKLDRRYYRPSALLLGFALLVLSSQR